MSEEEKVNFDGKEGETKEDLAQEKADGQTEEAGKEHDPTEDVTSKVEEVEDSKEQEGGETEEKELDSTQDEKEDEKEEKEKEDEEQSVVEDEQEEEEEATHVESPTEDLSKSSSSEEAANMEEEESENNEAGDGEQLPVEEEEDSEPSEPSEPSDPQIEVEAKEDLIPFNANAPESREEAKEPTMAKKSETKHDSISRKQDLPLASETEVPKKAKRRLACTGEIRTKAFADSILRTGLWVIRGCYRVPGEQNRVIIIIGQKTVMRECLAVARGILQAACHADAIIIDRAGSRSIFNGAKGNDKALPDIIGFGTSSCIAVCSQHRVTVLTEDCQDESSDEFVQTKLGLAKNLAGPYKIVGINVAKDLDSESEQVIKEMSDAGFPVLSLHDCSRPSFPVPKYASFPKPVDGNESEFASFLHVHLTVDLFALS